MLECAPRHYSQATVAHAQLRYLHDEADGIMSGPYPEDEVLGRPAAVTAGHTDQRLARLTIRSSADLGRWLGARGVRFQPALGGTLHLGRTNAFFLGGKALVNALYRTAEAALRADRLRRRGAGSGDRKRRFISAAALNGATRTRSAPTLWSRPRAGSRRTSPG